MVKTFYLHIGLPKTASTTFQDVLFPVLSGLDVRSLPRSRLFRTNVDRENDFRLFSCMARRDADVWKERGQDAWETLQVGASERSLLVSDEGVGRQASRIGHFVTQLEAIKTWSGRRGYERFAVLVMIRRQGDWLGSHYAQTANRRTQSSQADFEKWIEQTVDPRGELYGFGTLMRYDRLTEALSQVVGDDLFLAPMERLGHDPDDFLTELGAFLGTSIPAGALGKPRNVRKAGEASWHLRKAEPERSPFSLFHRREAGSPRTVTLTPRLDSLISATYGPGNAVVARRSRIPLATYGYALG